MTKNYDSSYEKLEADIKELKSAMLVTMDKGQAEGELILGLAKQVKRQHYSIMVLNICVVLLGIAQLLKGTY